jgi:nitrite reductase/ring-hydroxylating ferredoxin subunit/DMSO/TMAO reductase YedYZ heme-binding membrane subunit
MSAGFRAVQWNRRKIVYDAIAVAAVVGYLAIFLAVERRISPPKNLPDAIDLRILAFGSCAFLMLSAVLCIGPLARLDRRFLPFLYNRRHLGVLTFCVAALHAWFVVDWYLVQHVLPNLGAELTKWEDYAKFIDFPFKALGIAALLILFLMAATSHDYWLAFFSPRTWKGLHMAVYFAYGLVIMHVALGSVQDGGILVPTVLGVVGGLVIGLHLVAGRRGRGIDSGAATTDGWLAIGPPEAIPDKGARVVAVPGGERIAVFRDGDQVGALVNLCAHQGGPVGEGRIVDGLVTCPWHGFQYRLADGCAPAPFTEKLATYRVRIRNGVVEVDPRPLAAGTPAAIRCPLQAT